MIIMYFTRHLPPRGITCKCNEFGIRIILSQDSLGHTRG